MRAGVVVAIRDFFAGKGFLEVETPVMIPAPAPEEYIEAPAAAGGFLRSSPELEMKCMLAAGYEKIFQLGRCFRQGEHGGRHRPEFTMLEWYQADAGYLELAEFTREMLVYASETVLGSTVIERAGRTIDFGLPWQLLSVRDAYRNHAGIEMEKALEGDRFDELMVTEIEPCLGWGSPAVLVDYPACRASLARLKASDPTVAERWELYLGGIEIANAFSELTDVAEQKKRFLAAAGWRRDSGYQNYPAPEEFLRVLEHGMPEAAGCALGIDRLAMIFTGAADIGEVTYPCFRI